MKLKSIYARMCKGFYRIWLCPGKLERLSQYLSWIPWHHNGRSVSTLIWTTSISTSAWLSTLAGCNFDISLIIFYSSVRDFKRISSKKINEHCQEIQIRVHIQIKSKYAGAYTCMYGCMCCARKLPLISSSFFVVLNRSAIFHFGRFSFQCNHMKYKGFLGEDIWGFLTFVKHLPKRPTPKRTIWMAKHSIK